MEESEGIAHENIVIDIEHVEVGAISAIADSKKVKPNTIRKRKSRANISGGIKRKTGRKPAMTDKAKALFNIHGQTFLNTLDGFYFPDFIRMLRSRTPGLKECQAMGTTLARYYSVPDENDPFLVRVSDRTLRNFWKEMLGTPGKVKCFRHSLKLVDSTVYEEGSTVLAEEFNLANVFNPVLKQEIKFSTYLYTWEGVDLPTDKSYDLDSFDDDLRFDANVKDILNEISFKSQEKKDEFSYHRQWSQYMNILRYVPIFHELCLCCYKLRSECQNRKTTLSFQNLLCDSNF